MGQMVAKLQNGGIKVDGQLYGPENNMMESEKFLVYRICQELLNKSLKHSHGTNIRVVAKVEGTKATVTAIDKGDGFHTTGGEVFHLGSGLARIREAVRVRFGTVKLKKHPIWHLVSVSLFLMGGPYKLLKYHITIGINNRPFCNQGILPSCTIDRTVNTGTEVRCRQKGAGPCHGHRHSRANPDL